MSKETITIIIKTIENIDCLLTISGRNPSDTFHFISAHGNINNVKFVEFESPE
jgi:hypothetical protein